VDGTGLGWGLAFYNTVILSFHGIDNFFKKFLTHLEEYLEALM